MARYKYYSYEQGQFIPVQFDRQILPDTFEYALDYIVDNIMDVSVFEGRIKNDETGAPAYDPRILLKIVFYAYARGIITSREIEKACQENVMFMALSANTKPHFTKIAEFISTMRDGIEPLFLDVLMYCDRLGLIGKEMFAIDGCKISSNASKEWSGTKEDFENKKRKYKEAISYLVNKHREEDERGAEKTPEREKETKAKEGMETKIKKIQEWLDTHDDKPGQQGKVKKSHMMDNESAKMVSSHGVVQGYNGVAVVDAKHQVIVKAEAFGSGSEQETLKPMVEGVKETFKEMGEDNIYRKAKVTADSGFHNESNMKMMHDEEIDGYVADNQFRKRDPRYISARRHKPEVERPAKKYYGPDDFKSDGPVDRLICPAGKGLTLQSRNIKTRKGLYGVSYAAKARDCGACQLRLRCLQNPQSTRGRQVYKFEGWDESMRPKTFSQWMRERIDSVKGRFLYSQRMGIVEPVFANICDKLGLNRFTLRGKTKVDAQWKMYAVVHNMFKIYRYGWGTG
jgi:transposase